VKDVVRSSDPGARRKLPAIEKWPGHGAGTTPSKAASGQAHFGEAGASLSLQKHHHRAEHWVVVSGTAEVTRGSDTFLLTETNPLCRLGVVHRLHNPGKTPLDMIEVQSGQLPGRGRHCPAR
jgi:mannose-6-phosphate isomerase-like protein (cupin superfamily)